MTYEPMFPGPYEEEPQEKAEARRAQRAEEKPYPYIVGRIEALSAPEAPVRPANRRPWVRANEAGELEGYELALWHYRYIRYWRPFHNTSCPCGQQDDGEEPREVSLWLT